MVLLAFRDTSSNICIPPVLIVCHKVLNLSTIDDKELQFFLQIEFKVNYTTPAQPLTLPVLGSYTGEVSERLIRERIIGDIAAASQVVREL